MQVATFTVLGVSDFSCRLPEYLSAYLAVGLLCEFLIGRGLALAAIALAIAWVGDRSSLEVLYGRMDGIALLFLAASYVSLVRTLNRPSWSRGAMCGLSLGMAAGFHPVTVTFGVAAAALLAACVRGRQRLSVLCGFMAGLRCPCRWLFGPGHRTSAHRWSNSAGTSEWSAVSRC